MGIFFIMLLLYFVNDFCILKAEAIVSKAINVKKKCLIKLLNKALVLQ